MSVNQ